MQIQMASKVNLVYGTKMMKHARKDREDPSSFVPRIPYL